MQTLNEKFQNKQIGTTTYGKATLLYFSNTEIGSIAWGVHEYESVHKNIIISNLLTWLLSAILDVILN